MYSSLINIQCLGSSPHPPINKLGDAHYLVRPIIYMQHITYRLCCWLIFICCAYMLVPIVYRLELACRNGFAIQILCLAYYTIVAYSFKPLLFIVTLMC